MSTMAAIVTKSLDDVKSRPLKAALRTVQGSEGLRGGEWVRQAIEFMGVKAAAEAMQVSESLLSRQLENRDGVHLSFQRLQLLPADVRIRIALLMLRDCGAGVEIETTVKVRGIA
jgi:hypothetical protein